MVLAVPKASAVSLEECLIDHYGTEVLDAKNTYSCEECQQKVRAEKRLGIVNHPQVLVLGLKRMHFEGDAVEVRTAVHAPERMDLSAVALEPQPSMMYELVAVINHRGKDGSGHYTAEIRSGEEGTWSHLDDEQVSPSGGYRMEEAVLLAYQRMESRRKAEQSPSQDAQRRKAPKVWTRYRTKIVPWNQLSERQQLRHKQQVRDGRSRAGLDTAAEIRSDPVTARQEETRPQAAVEKRREGQTPEMVRGRAPDRGRVSHGQMQDAEADKRLDNEIEELTEWQLVTESEALAQRTVRTLAPKEAERPERRRERASSPEQSREPMAQPRLSRGDEQRALEEAEGNCRLELADLWRGEVGKWRLQIEELRERQAVWQKVADQRQENVKLQKLEEALLKSYYEVLGVSQKESATAIRAAYRRVALECHPDKFKYEGERATTLFKELQKAHETLRDPRAREAYDREMEAAQEANQPREHGEREREHHGGTDEARATGRIWVV